MNDQGLGNGLLYPIEIEQVIGSGIRPALYPLLACHLFHDYAQKVPSISAFSGHTRFKLLLVQPSARIEPADVPGIK